MTWDEMTPRQRDAWIAEKVMGWSVVEECKSFGVVERHLRAPGHPAKPNTVCNYITGTLVVPCLPNEFLPHYSTDIAAAWEVVEAVGRTWRGFPFMLTWEPNEFYGGPLWHAGWVEWLYGEMESRATAKADTISEAICHAAYKALGGS